MSMPAMPSAALLVAAGAVGAVFGVSSGCRRCGCARSISPCRTLGFATIVTQIALAWQSVTGGGIGVAGPGSCRSPSTRLGLLLPLPRAGRAVHLDDAPTSPHSRFGRALSPFATRRSPPRSAASPSRACWSLIFLFSGAMRGRRRRPVRRPANLHHAGRLHLRSLGAVLHRDPDRRSRLHPRAAARHAAAHRAAGNRGTARRVVDLPLRRAAAADRAADAGRHRGAARLPQPPPAGAQPQHRAASRRCSARSCDGAAPQRRCSLCATSCSSFGGVRAIDGLDLDVGAGRGARPDRPERQRQDHDAQRHLRLLRSHSAARLRWASRLLPAGAPQSARPSGIARTFQTPRWSARRSVLRQRHDRRHRRRARDFPRRRCSPCRAPPRRARCSQPRDHGAAGVVGLEALAEVRCDRLQHSELRFLEIARALMLRPGLSAARRARGRAVGRRDRAARPS